MKMILKFILGFMMIPIGAGIFCVTAYGFVNYAWVRWAIVMAMALIPCVILGMAMIEVSEED